MNLKSNFRLRELRAEDTEAIVAVYQAASTRDANIGSITPAQWVGFVQRPQNNGGRDFRVIVHDGRLVGLAESSLRDQNGSSVRFFKLVVEPLMRRRGVGTALLQALMALDEPAEQLSFQTLASSDWHDGIAFLEGRGFSHIESEIGMRCSSLAELSPPLPSGVSIRRCETPAGLAEDVARLHNAAFASDVAFRLYTASEMATLLTEDGQELWTVRDPSGILGYCRVDCEPQLTWVEEIAVDPSFHGQGLGTALVYEALRGAGINRDHLAGLNVSSMNGAVLSMYQKLGFVARREMRRYSAKQIDLNAALSLIS